MPKPEVGTPKWIARTRAPTFTPRRHLPRNRGDPRRRRVDAAAAPRPRPRVSAATERNAGLSAWHPAAVLSAEYPRGSRGAATRLRGRSASSRQANQWKKKGLSKLRWHCGLCGVWCKDANGFKMHIEHPNHLKREIEQEKIEEEREDRGCNQTARCLQAACVRRVRRACS